MAFQAIAHEEHELAMAEGTVQLQDADASRPSRLPPRATWQLPPPSPALATDLRVRDREVSDDVIAQSLESARRSS